MWIEKRERRFLYDADWNRKSRNCMSAPKIRKHQRDTLEIKPFSFPDASEQKAHSAWPVWNVTVLLITVRHEKPHFIKSVFQKQSNGARVALPFQESGLCKHGLKSVLNVTEKMIALAMTRTKCTKRTHNRYFTSWKNAQGGIADLSWRRSVVTM